MFPRAAALPIDEAQRKRLEKLVRAGATPQRLARRCQVILLAGQGASNHSIARETGLARDTVIATRVAFIRGGVEALGQPHKRRRSRRVLTPELERKILDTTLQTLSPEGTRWSVRALARHFRVSRTMVHRVLQRHGVHPRRPENQDEAGESSS